MKTAYTLIMENKNKKSKYHTIKTDTNGIKHLVSSPNVTTRLDREKFNAFSQTENYQKTVLDNSVFGIHMNETVFKETFYSITDKFSINPFDAENINAVSHLCGIIAWKKIFDVAPDNMNVIKKYHEVIHTPENSDAVSVAKSVILEKCVKHFDANRKCWMFEKREYKIPDKKIRIRHLCDENDVNETNYKTVNKSLFQGVLFEVRKSISSYDTFKVFDGRYTYTLSELDKTKEDGNALFDVPVYDRYTFDASDDYTLNSIRDFAEKSDLSENERKVLEIRIRYTGLGAKAISNSTGIPLGTVKSSLKRLKAKFEKYFKTAIAAEPMVENGIYHRTKVSKLFSSELTENELNSYRDALDYKRYIQNMINVIDVENDNPLFHCVPCAKSKNTVKTPDAVTMTIFDNNDLENIKNHCIYQKNIYVSDKWFNNLYTVIPVDTDTVFSSAENYTKMFNQLETKVSEMPYTSIAVFNVLERYKETEKKKVRITSKKVYTFNNSGILVRTKTIK